MITDFHFVCLQVLRNSPAIVVLRCSFHPYHVGTSPLNAATPV